MYTKIYITCTQYIYIHVHIYKKRQVKNIKLTFYCEKHLYIVHISVNIPTLRCMGIVHNVSWTEN